MIFATHLLPSCYAEPTADDLERVRRQFLVLRFHAPFDPALRGFDDKRLFEMSCQNHRVRCDRVLGMLKIKDMKFYGTLVGN